MELTRDEDWGSSLKEEIFVAFEGRTASERIDFHYRLNFLDRSVPFNMYNSDRDEVRHAQWLRRGMISMGIFYRRAHAVRGTGRPARIRTDRFLLTIGVYGLRRFC